MNKFDIHPKGVLPLGETKVQQIQTEVAPPPGYLAFMVSHPSFAKGNLIAAVPTATDLREWLDVLEKSARVTWDSAILGDQLITELREKGSKMLKKKNSLMQKRLEDEAEARRLKVAQVEAEEEIKRLATEHEKRQKDSEEVAAKEAAARAEREAVERELTKMKEKTNALEGERSKLEGKASQARIEADEVTKKLEQTRSKAQLALEAAEDAARHLEAEEKKAQKIIKKREKEVEKAAAARDKMLADIESERKKRLEAENMLAEAEDAMNNLDAMLRKSKKDLGVSVDLKNIRNMFERGTRTANAVSAWKKSPLNDELAALRVGNSDAKRQAMREATAAKRREQKAASAARGVGTDSGTAASLEPAAPQAAKVEVRLAAPASEVSSSSGGGNGGESKTHERVSTTGSAFDSEDMKQFEVEEDEEDGGDDSSDDEDDEPDEATMARATELFGNIDTNDNGFISKEEFLVALDYGDLEMTDEIKEYVDCRGNAEELLFFVRAILGRKRRRALARGDGRVGL